MKYDGIIDKGILPDFLMKLAVSRIIGRDIRGANLDPEEKGEYLADFLVRMNSQPVALRTADTKRQHYELPTEFFTLVLGSAMKYSCCLWPDFRTSPADESALDRAELAMLDLTASRTGIEDGMKILELGCGWGSLSLHLAERYPKSRITAVSHSATQKAWIDAQAASRGLSNLEVITSDMNDFPGSAEAYDRVVSIEMFEHMRNYRELFRRIAGWLKPGGKLFVHIFTIDDLPYFYDADNDEEWMARNFFAGGMMPSTELPLHFAENLSVERVWKVDGRHYTKTLLAWLSRMDRRRKEIMPVLENTYGKDANKWWNRWRLFFLSCAVVFGHKNGRIWNVTHYLFGRK